MRKSNLAMAMFWSNLESADLEPFAQYYIAKHQAGLKELEESIRGKHVGGKYDDRDLSRRSCRHSIDPDKGAEQRHLDQPKGMSLGVQALCTGESLISACLHRSGESGTKGGHRTNTSTICWKWRLESMVSLLLQRSGNY